MVYRFGKSDPGKMVLLPGEVLRHVKEATAQEAYILLFAQPYLAHGAEEEEILSALADSFSREEVLAALAFWRGCGVLKAEKGAKKSEAPLPAPAEEMKASPEKNAKGRIDADEAPFYSSADLATAAENTPDFKNLVTFAEGRLEKVMNTSELARLYAFLDYLKMPLDVVMLVIEDSAARGKKSLRYITKVLQSFQDEEIDTYEKAEAYFLRRKESVLYEKKVRDLFGLGTRKLTPTEETCLKTWRETYHYGEDMLNAAYEKTVSSAKNPSIKYMHKILESWHESGFTTPEEAAKAKKEPAGGEKSYELDDFFQQAVSNGRKKL